MIYFNLHWQLILASATLRDTDTIAVALITIGMPSEIIANR